MTADSTGKTSPGGKFRPPPANIWNNMVDAGQAFADGQLSSGNPGATRPRSTDVLRLKNSSGAARRKGEILKIQGKVITTITDEHIWLDGVAVTDDCRFGVLKEPAQSGEVIPCQVSGVCIAFVNITDGDHTFAKPNGGSHVLESDTEGPIEILYAPSGTGERECVVRFSRAGTTTSSATGCGSCQTVAETLTVPIGETGLNAAATYLFIALCGGNPFELEWTSDDTWDGTDTQSTTCTVGSVTVTLTMTISGYLPGDVVIAATGNPGGGGTVTLAQWENETAFQPGTNTVMRLVAGDLTCLCSPFEPFPCLIPVEPE